MVARLTSSHVIGDEYLVDYLELNSDSEYDFISLFKPEFILNKKYIFVVMFFSRQAHILLNSGVNCFCDKLISEDETIIVENDENFGFFTNRNQLQNLNFKILSGFMTTLMVRQKNGRYYVVDKDPTIRIVVMKEIMDQYNNIPLFQVRPNNADNFDLINPTVYYPRIYCITDQQITNQLNSYRKKKKIFFDVFLKILECAECPEKADCFGKNWVILNFGKISKENLRNNISLYRDWYEEMLSIYISIKNDKSHTNYCFYENSILYQYSHPDYALIEKEVLNKKCLISFCYNFNHLDFDDYRIWPTIFEVIPNTLFKTSKKVKEIHRPVIQITEEEAKRNADLLLEEEEKEIQKKNQQNSKKSKKKSPKTPNFNKKEIAKKIAYEAKDRYFKMESQRKKRINIEKKHRILALRLAEEAIQYLEKKIIPEQPYDDNSHCYIGSEEHLRRLQTWDLTQIIPEIYCLPKEFLLSLFSQKQSEALWLFTLEK